MFDWLFGSKKEVQRVEEDTKKAFESVKNDINKTGVWIKHLDKQDSEIKNDLFFVKEELSSIKEQIEGLANALSFYDMEVLKKMAQKQTSCLNKQTAVVGVQTPVQTAVQTAKFSKFLDITKLSVMERAIVMILLNTDMKLSYDDVAAMLGKERSTIRGHINRIKQKSEGLIEEIIERNGKKRLFMPEEVREMVLKSVKVRVKKKGKSRGNE